MALYWLVASTYPSENITLSVGRMTFPTEGKNEIHVANHQPDEYWTTYIFPYISDKIGKMFGKMLGILS
jgi:hypothetical protein